MELLGDLLSRVLVGTWEQDHGRHGQSSGSPLRLSLLTSQALELSHLLSTQCAPCSVGPVSALHWQLPRPVFKGSKNAVDACTDWLLQVTGRSQCPGHAMPMPIPMHARLKGSTPSPWTRLRSG